MEQNFKLDLWERLLTLAQVILVAILFSDELKAWPLALSVLIACGILLARRWFFLPEARKKVLLGLCYALSFFSIFWVFLSFFRFANKGYFEVIILMVSGAFFLLLAMSWVSFKKEALSYIQAILLFLILAFFIFVVRFTSFLWLCLIAYALCGILILKIKLYNNSDTPSGIIVEWHRIILIHFLWFAIVILGGVFLFSLFSLPQFKKGEIFLVEPHRRFKLRPWDKDDDRLLRQTQNRLSAFILNLAKLDQRREGVFFLSNFLKDIPDALEMEQAQTGLFSLFKEPGPGLLPNELEEAITIADKYFLRKAQYQMFTLERKILKATSRSRFGVKSQLGFLVEELISSRYFPQILRIKDEILFRIEKAKYPPALKEKLYQSVSDLFNWSLSFSYRQKLEELSWLIAKESSSNIKEYSKSLLQRIQLLTTPQETIQLKRELESSRQIFSQRQNLSRLFDECLNFKIQIISEVLRKQLHSMLVEEAVLEEARPYPLSIETKNLYFSNFKKEESSWQELEHKINQDIRDEAKKRELLALTDSVKELVFLQSESLKVPVLKKEETKEVLGRFWPWVLASLLILVKILFIMILFSLFFLPVWIITCYVLAKKKIRDMKNMFSKPNAFIIVLYNNLINILRLLEIPYQNSLGPVAFAKIVQSELPQGADSFLLLSEKFAEAKYSQHRLTNLDAQDYLRIYNDFLKNVLQKQRRLRRLFISFKALFNCIPLFVF